MRTMAERLNETQKYYNILAEREQKILETLESAKPFKDSNKAYEAMCEIQSQELYITRLAKDQLEDLINAEYGGSMVEIMKTGGNMVNEHHRQTKELEKLL